MLTKFFKSKPFTILRRSLKMPQIVVLHSKILSNFSNMKNDLPPEKKEFIRAQSKVSPETKGSNQKNEEDEKEDENSFFNEGKTSTYIFVVASLGLIGAYGMMQIYTIIYDKKTQKKDIKMKYTGTAAIGGPWKLVDTDGKVMTHKDLKGCYYLIYFGFCNCPDICPLTLQKISKAMASIEKMPEAKYFKLKCLFVSVDPERDTHEKIKKFLNLFEYKKIIGLTAEKNDSPELKEIMQSFKIYASKIYYENVSEKDKSLKNAYTIDHTIITYLMDDNNNYLNYLGSNLNEVDMADTIVESILSNEREKAKSKS